MASVSDTKRRTNSGAEFVEFLALQGRVTARIARRRARSQRPNGQEMVSQAGCENDRRARLAAHHRPGRGEAAKTQMPSHRNNFGSPIRLNSERCTGAFGSVRFLWRRAAECRPCDRQAPRCGRPVVRRRSSTFCTQQFAQRCRLGDHVARLLGSARNLSASARTNSGQSASRSPQRSTRSSNCSRFMNNDPEAARRTVWIGYRLLHIYISYYIRSQADIIRYIQSASSSGSRADGESPPASLRFVIAPISLFRLGTASRLPSAFRAARIRRMYVSRMRSASRPPRSKSRLWQSPRKMVVAVSR